MISMFSFGVALRRVYDSAPPECPAVFLDGARLLHPFEKANGLYVFVGERPCPLTVRCPGYLDTRVETQPGRVAFCGLFPAPDYAPPPGWRSQRGQGPPGRFWRTASARKLQLLDWDSDRNAARIRARPLLTGGMLRFIQDGRFAWSLILEKQPPDLFFVEPIGWEPAGGGVEQIWAARADSRGDYAAVMPAEEKEAVSWVMERSTAG